MTHSASWFTQIYCPAATFHHVRRPELSLRPVVSSPRLALIALGVCALVTSACASTPSPSASTAPAAAALTTSASTSATPSAPQALTPSPAATRSESATPSRPASAPASASAHPVTGLTGPQRVATGSLAPVNVTRVRGDVAGIGATADTKAPWVVSLGDSFISGEAGRWAGNTDGSESASDALGPTAYFDNATDTGELIPLCHRSKSAMVHIGAATDGSAVNSINLACSGAQTSTFTDSDGSFKPGIDFYNDGKGNLGQALMLQEFAANHDVRLVDISIGGNDFGFGPIATTCVEHFVFDEAYCSKTASVLAHVTPPNPEKVTEHIAVALQNVRTAMRKAGHADGTWSLVMNLNPDTLPLGGQFRYPATEKRQSTGGCGFYDLDATWADKTLLATIVSAQKQAMGRANVRNSQILDLTHALTARQLCAKGIGLYEEVGLASWQSPGAVDKTEWGNQVHIVTAGTDYFQQESLHPNYWAQLAFRSCLRQVWNNGKPIGGSCARSGSGLVHGEPVMTLQH